jgi:hypothetical protein
MVPPMPSLTMRSGPVTVAAMSSRLTMRAFCAAMRRSSATPRETMLDRSMVPLPVTLPPLAVVPAKRFSDRRDR